MAVPESCRLDIGDTELAVLEWPGEGPPVLLLHASGFHSRCWTQVVQRLPGQHIYAADLRFHGQSGGVGEVDWNTLTADICALVETLGLDDAIGVGHSIGGYLVARAAAAHPRRFRQLLLIDPVITSPEFYQVARELAERVHVREHPVSRRKNRWRDAVEMFERFSNRAPFDSWDENVLRDYCDYALRPEKEEGYRELCCDPIDEASVYLNQGYSDAVLADLPKLSMPVTLMRARYAGLNPDDLSASPTWPELAARIPDCREIYLPDLNHFIPMQDPGLVASHIREAAAT